MDSFRKVTKRSYKTFVVATSRGEQKSFRRRRVDDDNGVPDYFLYHAFVPWNLAFRTTARELGARRATCYWHLAVTNTFSAYMYLFAKISLLRHWLRLSFFILLSSKWLFN